MGYKQVTFDAGAPIDINDLNQLQYNIEALFTKIGQNVTPVIPIVYCGSATVTGLADNTVADVVVPLGTAFTATPTVVASSKTGKFGKDEIFSIIANATSPTEALIQVRSSYSGRNTMTVNYIAVQLKPVEG